MQLHTARDNWQLTVMNGEESVASLALHGVNYGARVYRRKGSKCLQASSYRALSCPVLLSGDYSSACLVVVCGCVLKLHMH